MSDQRLKIAVFIDFDNVEIGVKNTLSLQFDIGAVLEAIKERGEIITKVAYGDWKRAGDYGRALSQHAVRLVQRVMTPGGDKNGADINLALDALEMAFTHDHINAFVIVGGDSDFITLVEKLKQYDKKVFVVGGRSFTSQVMQKNCTEFIAYENVAGGARQPSPRSERGKSTNGAALEQALPLVKRALKVLNDREVTPQLGLLKSTLLQLDSSFSERDYGSSTFRDFAEKLEQRGWITLKHSGRTTLVELAGGETDAGAPAAATPPAPLPVDQRDRRSPQATSDEETEDAANAGSLLPEGVALFRAALQESATPPRWPMYMRQVKQFIRSVRPDFDERRYGSLSDLMRAAQKEGVVRLERDRQGGLRVFSASTSGRTTPVPHGWSTMHTPATAEADVEAPETQSDFGIVAPVAPVTEESAPPVEDQQLPVADLPAEKKRPRRPRTSRAAGESAAAPAALPARARKTRSAAAKSPRAAKRPRG